jgi:hypothetical protein
MRGRVVAAVPAGGGGAGVTPGGVYCISVPCVCEGDTRVKGSLWREKSAGHGVERAEGARGSWGRCVSAATMPWPRRGRSREAREVGAGESATGLDAGS